MRIIRSGWERVPPAFRNSTGRAGRSRLLAYQVFAFGAGTALALLAYGLRRHSQVLPVWPLLVLGGLTFVVVNRRRLFGDTSALDAGLVVCMAMIPLARGADYLLGPLLIGAVGALNVQQARDRRWAAMASNAAATGFAALAAAAVFGAVVVGVGERSVVAVMVAAVPAVLAFWLVNNLLVAVALRLSQGGSLPQRFRTLVTSETSILVFALLGALCGYAYRELGAWPGTLMLATVLGIADGMLMPRAPRLRSVDRQDEVRRDERQWVAAVVAVVGVGALVLVHASTGRLPGGAELGVLTGAAFLAAAVLARLDDLLARSAVVLAAVATLVVCRSDGPVLATALVAAAGVAGIAVTAGERPVALVVAAGRGAVLGGLTGVAAVVVTAGRIGTPFGLVTAGLVGGVVWAVAVAGPVLRRLRVVSGRLDGALVAGVLLAECDLLLAGLVGAVVGRLAVVGHSTAAGMVAVVVLAGAALLARSRETQPVRCEQPDERVLVGLQEALLDQRGLVPVDADE